MVSIVVATFNRPELCERSLRSVLLAMAHLPEEAFEIIAGVNGVDPETKSVLKKLQAENPDVSLRMFEFERQLTPGACRNHLIIQAKGEWIYFLDDDAYVDSDFFIKWKSCGLKDQCAAIGGPNLNPPEANMFQRAASQALASPFATYFSSARYVPSGEARLCSESSLILCNLFVKREVLDQEPFLETLFCAEENWLLQNLKKKGFMLGYDPSLSVWHERRPDLRSFIKQVFKYGYGRGQIFRRRSWGLRPAHVLPTLCVVYTFALVVGVVFTGSLPSVWILAPFLLYAALCLIFAINSDRKHFVVTAILFPVIHVNYGLGFLWGIIRG